MGLHVYGVLNNPMVGSWLLVTFGMNNRHVLELESSIKGGLCEVVIHGSPSRLSYKRRFREGYLRALWLYLRLRNTAVDADEAEDDVDKLREVIAQLNWRSSDHMCRDCHRYMLNVINRVLK